MSQSTMFKHYCVAATLLLALAFPAYAGEHEWVKPEIYDFGNCGGLGGDSVPGTIKRYYSKYECARAFDENKCDTQARWYERQFYERKNN